MAVSHSETGYHYLIDLPFKIMIFPCIIFSHSKIKWLVSKCTSYVPVIGGKIIL